MNIELRLGIGRKGKPGGGGFTPPPPSFTPANLGATLKLWVKANDAATITHTSGSVTVWGDKSGNAKHLNIIPSTSPITGTRTINSKNVIDFNGVNQSIRTTSRIFTAPSARTLIWVAKVDTIDANFRKPISERSTLGMAINYTNTNQVRMTHDYTGATFVRRNSVDNSVDTINPHIMAITWDGGNTSAGLHLYKNGSPELTYSLSADGTLPAVNADGAGFCVGSEFTTANTWFDGMIGEIIVCDSVLNQTDLNLVGNYLATEWGIAWTNFSVSSPSMTWGDGTIVTHGIGLSANWSA